MVAAGRLRLPLRTRVWKGQAGEFLGAGTGSSLDFQDHRVYVPGDDPRHINWQAYARTGNYTMKLYREEVRPVVDLVFDVSDSMFFEESKARRSVELFYLVAESALQSGASLLTHVVRGDATMQVTAEMIISHRWVDLLEKLKPADAAAAPSLEQVPLRANAVRAWVSDLLFPGDPQVFLRTLGANHGDATVLIPFATAEANPDWSGNYEFVDAERDTRHPHRVEPSVLKRYRESYVSHFALWKQAARRHHTALARVDAEQNFERALFAEAVSAGALETA